MNRFDKSTVTNGSDGIPSPGAFREQAQKILRNWYSARLDTGWFRGLAMFKELCLEDELRVEADAVRRLMEQALDRLHLHESKFSDALRLRFLERTSVTEVAHAMNIVDGTVYKWQRQGLDDLGNQLHVMETQAVDRRRRRLRGRLEAPSYTTLFGVDDLVTELSVELLKDGPPWIVAVEGMGGLGKTALADRIMRGMVDAMQWVDLAWVTARQSYFNLSRIISSERTASLTPAALVEILLLQITGHAPYTAAVGIDEGLARLRERLSRCPHLVVIDNLESIDDMEAILATVRQIAGPSKFLLTTRRCPFAAGDIFHFRIPSLSPENSLKLIRHEAGQRNLPRLADAEDETLYPIVDLVGGNPLALRLVIGQLHVHSLDNVLVDLAEVRSSPVESMYTYLYRQAWDRLDEQARSVLLSMPLVAPQGEDLDYIRGLGSLTEPDLRDALNRLVELNLVDSVGDLHERRYMIHSLTRTFLQTHILNW